MKLPELDFILEDGERDAARSDVKTGWETVVFNLEDEEEDDA
jgi:hypothetical protein